MKDILQKTSGIISKEELMKITFGINCHDEGESGSRAERFLRRRPRSNLPNSILRELKFRDLIKSRHQKQLQIAKKKGRTSRDVFMEGDAIRVQDPVDRHWKKKGVIKEIRKSPDNQAHSFIIQLEEGGQTIRHKSHIKHDTVSEKKRSPTVRFLLPNDTKDNSADSTHFDFRKLRSASKVVRGKEQPEKSGQHTGSKAKTRQWVNPTRKSPRVPQKKP